MKENDPSPTYVLFYLPLAIRTSCRTCGIMVILIARN